MWKQQAEALFFIDHMPINEITTIVQVSRQSVSAHLNDCEGYRQEMAWRKGNTANNRKAYQRQWDKDNRADRYTNVNGDSLKREHDLAVAELSKERYYG